MAEKVVVSCDFFMSVGTSAEVYPAAGLIEQAIQVEADVLEINPEATAFSSRVSWSIRGKSGDVLPQIVGMALPDDASASETRQS